MALSLSGAGTDDVVDLAVGGTIVADFSRGAQEAVASQAQHQAYDSDCSAPSEFAHLIGNYLAVRFWKDAAFLLAIRSFLLTMELVHVQLCSGPSLLTIGVFDLQL